MEYAKRRPTRAHHWPPNCAAISTMRTAPQPTVQAWSCTAHSVRRLLLLLLRILCCGLLWRRQRPRRVERHGPGALRPGRDGSTGRRERLGAKTPLAALQPDVVGTVDEL
eukprot:7527176-Pyramimonas_sp.AAC.1